MCKVDQAGYYRPAFWIFADIMGVDVVVVEVM